MMSSAYDSPSEGTTLLPHTHTNGESNGTAHPHSHRHRVLVRGGLLLIALIALAIFLFTEHPNPWASGGHGGLPRDPRKAVDVILRGAPVIDGHIDLPWLVRTAYRNNASAIELDKPTYGHVDIPRLRAGHVGGFFWSVYTPCPDSAGEDPGKDFLKATSSVRDTLEQIDISHQLIHKYSDTFKLALTARDVADAVQNGKIAALLGVEGGHQLGNSLGALRQFAALGVRYVTLTHVCHNVFADSSGIFEGIEPLHHGLSPFGETLVQELNRLGVLVDLSHTSDATALAALNVTRAPVIWSHSSARSVHNIPRNVPDEVLRHVGTGVGQRDGVVMVNFYPRFVSADPEEADVKTVADHVEHIASVTGRAHVGIGSDYDGIESCPKGLEDVSTYPALIEELYSRGWTADELRGVTGANFLRVFAGAEDVAKAMAREGIAPTPDLYEKRADVPSWKTEL
ncbi:membrane dipeptidase-domain-containing protein [Multifurca ochricompacta]|uniref:Dipeptidase n=1 Tax=Multifurca ochricompacta TaxID=376703 RepID=A0AAD4QLI1_9AGAM|nr:membrane dipeptidase-domain-containing protein [Multifurca ochricompacta]